MTLVTLGGLRREGATLSGSDMGHPMAFEWVSLDGVFDAEPKLFSRWFLPFHSEARDACIRDASERADALLLGRRTYEMLAPFWSAQTDDAQGPARALNALRLLVHPCVMGEGRRWTGDTTPATPLELEAAAPLDRGVVPLDYRLRTS